MYGLNTFKDVTEIIMLAVCGLNDQDSISKEDRDFSLCQYVQIGCGGLQPPVQLGLWTL